MSKNMLDSARAASFASSFLSSAAKTIKTEISGMEKLESKTNNPETKSIICGLWLFRFSILGSVSVSVSV